MLNSKFEKILIALFWYFSLFILTRFFPVSNPTRAEQVLYITVVTGVTFVFYKLYVKFRDNYIIRKIQKMGLENNLSSCLEYIEKCIKNNKKILWLRFERISVLALMGEISAYENALSELKKFYTPYYDEKYNELFYYFNCMFSYIKEEKNSDILIKYENCNNDLKKIIWLLSNFETMSSDEVEKYAGELSSIQYSLYKSFLNLILAKKFVDVDKNKYTAYAHYAKSYAPSKEFFESVVNRMSEWRGNTGTQGDGSVS